MAKITYPNKQTAVNPNSPAANEIFYAANANEVKASVNALYDRLDNIVLVDGFVSGPNLVATSTTNVAIQTFSQNVAFIYNANGFQYIRNAGAADLTFTATPDASFDKGCIIQGNGTTISLKQGTAAANVIYPTPDTGYVQLYSFIISTTGINSILVALGEYVQLNNLNIGDVKLDGKVETSKDSLINGLTIGVGGKGTLINNTAIGYRALFNETIAYQTNVGGYFDGDNPESAFDGLVNIGNGCFVYVDNYYNPDDDVWQLDVYWGTYPANTNLNFSYTIPASYFGSGENIIVDVYSILLGTASKNTAIGYQSDFNLTYGYENTSVGYQSGFSMIGGYQNSYFGYQSGFSNQNGYRNVGLGYKTLYNGVGTYNNIAIGYQASLNMTGGNENIAIGSSSLYNNIGNENIAIGNLALYNNQYGNNNLAIGNQTLKMNTSGQTNIAIGYQAMTGNTTGSNNLAIGYYSLRANTTGTSNSSIGYQALYNNVTGSFNTAFGFSSLLNNTTQSNTAVGYNSLKAATTGGYSTGIGESALLNSTTGAENTAIGTTSLAFITTGSLNAALGNRAGRYYSGNVNMTLSDNSVYLGAYAKALANGQTNQIVIGYDATGLGSNSVVIGNDSIALTALKGSVLIGTSTDVASSILTLSSTTKGFLTPRMTTTQINAIATPAQGIMVFNTTLTCHCFYDGSGWRKISHSSM